MKGAVIASDATLDKNKLSTGTLTYSDIQNNAQYSSSSVGVGYGWGNPNGKDASGKEIQNPNNGFSYSPSIPVSGKADSTTKSAIAAGTIEVRNNPNVDLNGLSRDTGNSLNALGKIFDKKSVQEQKELVNLFSEVANNLIGDLAESEWKKAKTPEEKAKWAEGGEYKILLHAVVGGLTSDLAGNGFTTGAVSAGLSQAAQKELGKITNPQLRLIASAAIGAAAAKIVGGNASVGAGVAYNGRKYNDDNHKPTTEGSIIKRDNKYYQIDANGEEQEINTPATGTVFWADGAYYKINADGTDGYFYKPGTIVFDNGQYWVARSDGNYDYTTQPSAGTLVYANGKPLIVDSSGKQWDPEQYLSQNANSLPTLSPGTVIAAGTVTVIVAGVTIYLINGNWYKAAATGTGTAVVGNAALKSPELMNELAQSGAKYTAENVVAITRAANGQLVWLETGSVGSRGAGLAHILEEHASDFAAKGIESNQIPEFLMTALSKGNIIAYQGQGTGRPIYEVMYNGIKQYVGITVGSNGFIVGANPVTLP